MLRLRRFLMIDNTAEAARPFDYGGRVGERVSEASRQLVSRGKVTGS
jgi:hypothetical protein